MTKLKQPLLSLGAAGTLGDTLTFNPSRSSSTVRTKPIPPYSRTLAQQYQRWDYQDAGWYWQTLTQAQKDAYRITASRFHIPRYAAFLRYYLTNLPDLAGRWHLDTPVQATTPDSSKNSNTGTVFGCTPADGLIDGAFSFDGINDTILIPHSQSLTSQTFTIEGFIYIHSFVAAPNYLYMKADPSVEGYQLGYRNTGALHLDLNVPGLKRTISAAAALSLITKYHIAATRSGALARLFIDGQEVTYSAQPALSDFIPTTRDAYIGSQHQTFWWANSIIDHFALYNRVLSDPQIKAHSERRFP